MNKRIYLSPPHMSGTELDYVKEAFNSNWIAPIGPHVDAFEIYVPIINNPVLSIVLPHFHQLFFD